PKRKRAGPNQATYSLRNKPRARVSFVQTRTIIERFALAPSSVFRELECHGRGGGRIWFSYDNGSQREAAETCRETRRLRAVASLRRHPDRPTVTHHLKMLSVYQLSNRTGWHVRD